MENPTEYQIDILSAIFTFYLFLARKTLLKWILWKDVSIQVMPQWDVLEYWRDIVNARKNAVRLVNNDCVTSSAKNLTMCLIGKCSTIGSVTRKNMMNACFSAVRSIQIYSSVWTNLSPMARHAIARPSIIRSSIGDRLCVWREYVG